MSFDKPYAFAMQNTVVIKHNKGKFLRVQPNNLGTLCPNGGTGAFAQWEAQPSEGGNKVKLQNKKTGKYLRIVNGKIDVNGGGGPYTLFKVHKSGHSVKLESNTSAGLYIAVGMNGQVKLGKGGPFCQLSLFRQHAGAIGYQPSKQCNIALMCHDGKYLRVMPNGSVGYTPNIGPNAKLTSCPVPGKPGLVGLKRMGSNHYLQCNPQLNLGVAQWLKEYEEWRPQAVAGGKFTFRSVWKQRFLCADPKAPIADREQPAAWESFKVVLL